MTSDYLVIMPTYNEKDNLPQSISELFKYNPSVDLLVVDDASPDGTGQLADQISQANKRISVLHRSSKEGLGPAYLAGFEYGLRHDYKFLVEMDADGSHRAVDLPELITASKAADLVIGSRWVSGGEVVNWPLLRKLISKAGNLYTRVLLRSNVRDMTAGFRIYRSEFLQKLNLNNVASHGYSFQVEMAWRSIQAKARIIEVPITFVEREQGVSKMTGAIVAEALWLVTKWGISRKL
jgi:dolichol-phosphate mannosyltransferase